MLTIALDAMGGDHAPVVEVEGAVLAVRQYGVKVILVGLVDRVRAELEKYDDYRDLPIEVVHASERITMDDPTTAVRTKQDSSLRVASRLVRDGKAEGLVSAGNTGAAMATAKIVQGVVPGVTRPALAGVFPTVKGPEYPVVVLDVGANVDCSARMLAQFAVMGEIYSRVVLRRDRPRVGILSIGEEAHKGNDLTRAARELIKELQIDFVGNVEGRDIYGGNVDVIVCDGFIGNVALKVSEGLVTMVTQILRESLESSIQTKIGAVLSKPAFNHFKRRLDYSETGGAPLLGVRGVCIICHGRSNSNAIKNAIRVAAEFSNGKVNQRIEDELAVAAK
ncbi:MAG: phosphate acyltransferase PlsX [Bryobacteraceae bacterium]|jgi:glycerol-3-phosphate acyltransferase PlsX